MISVSTDLSGGECPDGSSAVEGCGGGLKSCTDCRTTKTPLWRGGPSGPKSLCNACGIRYRKKRREILGLKDGVPKIKEKKKSHLNSNSKSSSSSASISRSSSGVGSKMSVFRLLGLGADALLKQRSLIRLKKRRRLGEEEEAAVLLMALSSGFLYA